MEIVIGTLEYDVIPYDESSLHSAFCSPFAYFCLSFFCLPLSLPFSLSLVLLPSLSQSIDRMFRFTSILPSSCNCSIFHTHTSTVMFTHFWWFIPLKESMKCDPSRIEARIGMKWNEHDMCGDNVSRIRTVCSCYEIYANDPLPPILVRLCHFWHNDNIDSAIHTHTLSKHMK